MFLSVKLLKKIVIFVGLIQFISIKPMNIKLSSKEKKEFTVNKAMIMSLSGLVKTALDTDEHATEVPILGVSSRELGYLVGNDLIEGGLLKAIYNKNEEQIDKSLSEIINKLSDDELFELIKAANYMDSPQLLNFLISKLAERIVKDKAKKELLEKFVIGIGLKNAILKTIEKIQNALDKEFVETPLGDLKSMEDLIKKGANINAKDKNGRTKLINAARNLHNTILIEIVNFALKNKADLNIKENDGYDVLWWVIYHHTPMPHGIILQKLIDAGANTGEKYAGGKTLLMTLVSTTYNPPDLEFVKTLLKAKGTDVNTRDNEGRTALTIANQSRKNAHAEKLFAWDDVIDLLRKAGAKE